MLVPVSQDFLQHPLLDVIGFAALANASTCTNFTRAQGAEPHIVHHEGYYYFPHSQIVGFYTCAFSAGGGWELGKSLLF